MGLRPPRALAACPLQTADYAQAAADPLVGSYPCALSAQRRALKTAEQRAIAPKPRSPGKHSESASTLAPEDESGLVVVLGRNSSEKADFCQTLAKQLAGTLVCVRELVAAAVDGDDPQEQEVRKLVLSGKMAPPECIVALLGRATARMRAPLVLVDFPKTARERALLEDTLGPVRCALQLELPNEVALAAQLGLDNVATMIPAGTTAVGAATSAYGGSVAITRPAGAFVGTMLVPVIGRENEAKTEFCTRLAQRLKAKLLHLNDLIALAIEAGGAESGYLQQLLVAGKMVPPATSIDLISRAITAAASKEGTFVLTGFPKSNRERSLLESAFGPVQCAIELQQAAGEHPQAGVLGLDAVTVRIAAGADAAEKAENVVKMAR